MTVARNGVWLATLVGAFLQVSGSAFAYVRAVTGARVAVAWKSPCVTMQIDLTTPPPVLTAAQYWNASQLAAQAWSHDDVSCTGLSITMEEAPAGSEAGFDGKNLILFRASEWCRLPAEQDPTRSTCYAANAMAVTTLFKRTSTGEIVDADIEINAVGFAWGDLVTNSVPTVTVTDFQNTLTHELGHVIGLGHNCYSPNDKADRLLDNNGNPEVDCAGADVPPAITDATMFPAVSPSDIDRRTLSPDDRQAVCDVYPSAAGVCGAPSGHGCSMVAHPSGESRHLVAVASAAFAVAFLMAVLGRSRRRGRVGAPRTTSPSGGIPSRAEQPTDR
jgi:hypothetical protein